MRVICIRNCAPWPAFGVYVAPQIGDRATVLEEVEGGGYLLEEFPLPVGFYWTKKYFVPLEGDEIEEFEQATGLDKYERREAHAPIGMYSFNCAGNIRWRT